jgi:hypothetical protein
MATRWLAYLRSQGVQYRITSTRRTFAEQLRLYLDHLAGRHPGPVAFPGYSDHEKGKALDVVFTNVDPRDLVDVAAAFFLKWQGSADPVHWSLDCSAIASAAGAQDHLYPECFEVQGGTP